MKKLYFIQLLLFSIVFASWNNPYINTDETLKLEYGMSKSNVLETLGNPLYVDKGWPDSGSNTIVWVYKVRTTDVQSKQITGGPVEVVKSSNSKKPSSGEHHDLVLTFKNNKLVTWESKIEEKSTSNIEMPSIPNISVASSASSSWAIDFKLSANNESWEFYPSWWDDSDSSDTNLGFRIGTNISKPMFGMNVGFDISFGYGSGIMLFLEKELYGFDFSVSFGEDINDVDSDDGTVELRSTLKLGIFRDFVISGYPLSFGMEHMVRDSDYFYFNEGSSTLWTVKYKFR